MSGLENQIKDYVYKLFMEYYSNLNMYKIKDTGGYSVYYAKISTLLACNRYIMVTTPQDINVPGTLTPLSSIRWISLQARETNENYKIPKQSYTPSERSLNNLQNIFIIKKQTESTHTIFDVEHDHIPLSLAMLRPTSTSSFPDRFSLEAALKEFQTVITITS